jgi:hypothetical protein
MPVVARDWGLTGFGVDLAVVLVLDPSKRRLVRSHDIVRKNSLSK